MGNVLPSTSPLQAGFAVSTADLSKLTAIIYTADRPKALKRLLKSLKQGYPDLRVQVADASEDKSRLGKGVDRLQLPVGASRSVGFNTLLARLRTPYFLLLDDRCELQREVDIRPLFELVTSDQLDIAGGDLIGCRTRFWFFTRRRPQPGHGLMDLTSEQLTLTRGHRTVAEGFNWCDMVANFYVARTDRIRSLGGWDQELGNDEREEFFVRAQRRGLRVGIVPEVTAWAWHEPSELQTADHKSLAVAKMGLTRMTDFEGHVIKAPRRAAAA